MRVICDKCGASYKISDDRLTRDVNKATCRKCGEPIYIRRPGSEPVRSTEAPRATTEEDTKITSAADLERQARSRASSLEDALGENGPDVTVPRTEGPPPDPSRATIAPGSMGQEATVVSPLSLIHI